MARVIRLRPYRRPVLALSATLALVPLAISRTPALAPLSHDDSPRDALEALDILERDPTSTAETARDSALTADFLRGNVLAHLGLCHLAAQAFDLATTREDGENRRKEVDQRLAGLPCRHRIASQSTLDGKLDTALDIELPAAAAALSTPAESAALDRLSTLGRELKAAGEPLVAQVADELADRRRVEEPELRRAILDATLGRTAFLSLDFDRSRQLFDGSCGMLRQRGSALAGWCRFWQLAASIYLGELGAARKDLASLRASTRSPYLRGRAAWSEGLAAFREGALGTAYDLFGTAANELSAARLSRSHAAVEILRAEVLSDLGALDEAARVRRSALVELQGEEPYFALLNGLIDGANDAHLLGFSHAADSYLAEATLLAREQGNRVTETEILLLQGELLLDDNRSRTRRDAQDVARNRFLAARALAVTLDGDVARRRNLAAAELGLAEAGDPSFRDRSRLHTLADYFAQMGPRSQELSALAVLVEIAEEAEDVTLAADTYRRAEALIDSQRSSIHGIARDARFLASQRTFFDRMIAGALRRGDAWWALSLLADGSPGVVKIPWTRSGDQSPPPMPDASTPGSLGAQLAESLGGALQDRALVVYHFLDERLLWWTIHDGRLQSGAQEASPVRALVDELRASRGQPTEAQLENGYQLLLAEPLAAIEPGTPLVFVLDDDLTSLPFAAMRKSVASVRLIEQHPLNLAMNPDAVSVPRASQPSDGPPRAAVVGDPAFDRAQLPWLDRLPGALAEARAIAQVYGPRTRQILGEAATADAIRSRTRGVAVLHVAAHVLAGRPGEGTALVLAADSTNRSGLSSAEDLAAAGDSPELVVLSACGTLDARGSDGLVGLAGPFLERGTSAVVGTLWPVDDREIARWMIELHRLLVKGVRASLALQQVQSHAAATEPCCQWAALALVGDVAFPASQPPEVAGKKPTSPDN